ncbi:MAG TPA: SbcC/MukB-like Walker B domain-containing protein [Anaerolineales bacterium]|nr:SbcC/MukB-like Walker B domain-containing protein [Anaerolineales bacterium]
MKLLTHIRLINWHLFENATIDCQGTTYFIGINGAGKSTILDAVQFALVGGQRDVRFNQAALSGGKRTLASYVRGELGTEGQRYLRGDATGVAALEFKNPDGTSFTHGAVIDAYEDGRAPDVTYFIVHNAALNDSWFFKTPGQLFDTRAFKRHLENFALPPNASARVFTRLEDYRVHLLNRLGQLKDSFPAKIVKGLAFSPLTDIRSFVHNYLLEENLLDVKTLQAQLETLRHFESLAADVRERIDSLTRIEDLDKERLANRRRRITNTYVARRAQADAYLDELKSRRLELDSARLDFQREEIQRGELSRYLRFAQSALTDAEIALRTDRTAQREKELSDKIALLTAEQTLLTQRQTKFDRALAAELADAKKLKKFLTADKVEIPVALESFIKEKVDQRSSPMDKYTDTHAQADAEQAIRNTQEALSNLGEHFSREETLLNEQAAQLKTEAARLEDEIRKLRTGDRETSYEAEAPNAARLRRILRAELGLGANEVVYLCDVLQIPDPDWQNAVEGLLGFNRFTLLVPPTYYDDAMQLYRKHKDMIHGAALLDTEAILRGTRNTETGTQVNTHTLAAEVATDHPAAGRYVDLLLGHYVKCDTVEQLRDHRTAITQECFVRHNFTDRHLNPQVYKRWFIGERAALRQIEQREQRIDEIAGELKNFNKRETALHERLGLTRAKIRPLVELETALPALRRLAPLEAELAALSKELAALDAHTVETLKAEVEKYQRERDQLQDEVLSVTKKLGNLEEKIKQIETESIPSLERSADESLRSAEAFLLQENADEETISDVQKEYERRRERQPLEVILQNASRYENDYQTAEGRSRDRLREAKQTYSIRYDFGSDDADDATRYMVEKEKLITSELPNYENQIAHQRGLAEQELVENFIHRLHEQIEDARQQLAFLNDTLANLRFGGERFEFVNQPAPALRQVFDMVMDSQQVMGDSLFDSDFRQRHQQGWDLLFERLTSAHDNENAELRELQDYRNYLQYDIRIHYPNGDRALLSQINAKKSGGETTTPFYVAMAASFAQAYRLNQARPSDTIRLALFDEAFSKMDTARTASALHFMREAGLQVLLATPPDKSGSLLPYVDSVCTVVRKNNHSFVIEIDKREMMEKLESQ